MNNQLNASRSPGFWRTLRLLLGAARRRAAGRSRRQKKLLHNRAGKSADPLGGLAVIIVIIFMALINGAAGYAVCSGISVGQRMEAARQGKIVVSQYFLEALREIESEESALPAV